MKRKESRHKLKKKAFQQTFVLKNDECGKIKRKINLKLPGGESNPGLPRDRRGYSPLYYRGPLERNMIMFQYKTDSGTLSRNIHSFSTNVIFRE